VLDQTGIVRIVRGTSVVGRPFLDIRSKVSSGEERGLLGLAFSPNFLSNQRFYVDYTDLNGDTVVASYRVTADPDVADTGSEVTLLHSLRSGLGIGTALLDAAESLGGDSDLGELRAALANAQQAAATAAAAPKLPPLKMSRPPRPKYPASAKGVEGWVRVEFFVTPEGRTERVRVLSSEPAGLFDAAAIAAMEAARFEEFDSTDARLAVQRIVFKPE
jgi:TonB family protein